MGYPKDVISHENIRKNPKIFVRAWERGKGRAPFSKKKAKKAKSKENGRRVGRRAWARELPEAEQAGRGHVRRGFQGARPAHRRDCCAQENPHGLGRGGHSQHHRARNRRPQGAAPSEHRLPARRGEHRKQALPGLRVHGPGSEALHGLRPRTISRPAARQILLLPDPARPCFLPFPPCSPPRHEAAEPADQQSRSDQAGRFRPRPGVWHSTARVHARGCDAVVPRSRDSAGAAVLLPPCRHLERWSDLWRDARKDADVSGRLGDRRDLPRLPHPRDALGAHLAGRHAAARLERQLSHLARAALRSSFPQRTRRGSRPACTHACIRACSPHQRKGGSQPPLLCRPQHLHPSAVT